VGFKAARVYDSAVLIIGLILLGRTLEARPRGTDVGRYAAFESAWQAKTARVLRPAMAPGGDRAGGRGRLPLAAPLVPRRPVDPSLPPIRDGHHRLTWSFGDLILVRPGEKIPVTARWSTRLGGDESMLTAVDPCGEGSGGRRHRATLNPHRLVPVPGDKGGRDKPASQIVRLVEERRGRRPHPAGGRLCREASIVPVVLGIAPGDVSWCGFSRAAPKFTDALLLRDSGDHCLPVRHGTGAPTAIVVGTGKGAENGDPDPVGCEALERAHKLNVIVLDKTGTLTEGKPRVTDIVMAPGSGAGARVRAERAAGIMAPAPPRCNCCALRASAERGSEHPLGEAIVEEAKARGLDLLDVSPLRGHSRARGGSPVVSPQLAAPAEPAPGGGASLPTPITVFAR